MIHIPKALVLGCNTPYGINVLSDWIEEQTGHKPEFHESGWTSKYYYYTNTCSDRNGYGYDWFAGNGNGFGDGNQYGNGCGDSTENSFNERTNGDGYGCYSGNGYGFGDIK